MLSSVQQRRRLVPQWRSFSLAAASSEVASPAWLSEKSVTRQLSFDLVERIEKFRLKPDVVAAAELLESAVIQGQDREAINAARVLIRSTEVIRPVKMQAARLLTRTGHKDEAHGFEAPSQILSPHLWRLRARSNPRDAIAWTELALAQLCNNHREGALKSMRIALALAPHSRYVLRAASRLFFHVGEFDRAHDLLKRNEATPGDPWLMSAEIALSSFADRSPVFWKQGMRLVAAGELIPAQLSELAGAIGTKMIEDASTRKGRNLMRQSQLAPTANALAQAEWLTIAYRENVLEPNAFRSARRAWEAMSQHAFFNEGNFEKAMGCAEKWIEEERYNPAAYVSAAVSANLLERFADGIEWAVQGLRLAKDLPPLHDSIRNSIVFALASMGQLDEAEKLVSFIQGPDNDKNAIIAGANHGLIAMRRGNFEIGKRHYEKAISHFKKLGLRSLEASAQSYFATELARGGFLEDAQKRIDECKAMALGANHKHVEIMLKRAERLIEVGKVTATIPGAKLPATAPAR